MLTISSVHNLPQIKALLTCSPLVIEENNSTIRINTPSLYLLPLIEQAHNLGYSFLIENMELPMSLPTISKEIEVDKTSLKAMEALNRLLSAIFDLLPEYFEQAKSYSGPSDYKATVSSPFVRIRDVKSDDNKWTFKLPDCLFNDKEFKDYKSTAELFLKRLKGKLNDSNLTIEFDKEDPTYQTVIITYACPESNEQLNQPIVRTLMVKAEPSEQKVSLHSDDGDVLEEVYVENYGENELIAFNSLNRHSIDKIFREELSKCSFYLLFKTEDKNKVIIATYTMPKLEEDGKLHKHKYTLSYEMPFETMSGKDAEFHKDFLGYLTSKGAKDVKLVKEDKATEDVLKVGQVYKAKTTLDIDNSYIFKNELLAVTQLEGKNIELAGNYVFVKEDFLNYFVQVR